LPRSLGDVYRSAGTGTSGLPCDFGSCQAPIGNTFGPGLVLAGGAEGLCIILEPCGASELILGGLFLGTVAAIDTYNYYSKGGKQNIVPSWAEGARPSPGESASQFADRLCRQQYPPDGSGCGTGPTSERSKIQKWARDKFGI
jgi:hypothetical protein